jgi:protease IV
MAKQQSSRAPWLTIIIVLLLLGFFSVLIAGVIGVFLGVSTDPVTTGNVAVIPVEGVLVTTKAPGFQTKGAVSGPIVKLIEKADKDKNIKAVVLAINTPGGSAVASDEIAEALDELNKTSVAWIRDIGTSGGYWVASATDHIIAHPASFTGSIGVIGSYLEFSGLMDQHDVTYRRLVAGKLKDMGNPFKTMTPEEQAVFQQSLDELHGEFIDEIARNRNMDHEYVKQLATGQFYTGMQAHKYGLVDELGSRGAVKAYVKKTIGEEPKFVTYTKPKSFIERLAEGFSDHGFQVGRGLASSMKEEQNVLAKI